MNPETLPLPLRRAARRAVDAHASCPVVLIPGDNPPKLVGESFHFTTPGGRPVRYPNAYRRAYGKPVYHPSTLRVEVGAGFPLR